VIGRVGSSSSWNSSPPPPRIRYIALHPRFPKSPYAILEPEARWIPADEDLQCDESLARNFLLIAPNIIVLDRLRTDFDGAKIFLIDPVLPENGFRDRNWRHEITREQLGSGPPFETRRNRTVNLRKCGGP
jgi:hypothetical protein